MGLGLSRKSRLTYETAPVPLGAGAYSLVKIAAEPQLFAGCSHGVLRL